MDHESRPLDSTAPSSPAAPLATDPAAAQADVESFVATALAEGLLEEAP
jgi:hypothetical protein